MKRIVIAICLVTGPLLLTGCLMSHQYRVIRHLDSHAGSQRFDPAQFRAIDDYAVKAPEQAAASIETLGDYLARPEWSELARVRAIWRWLTSHIEYDVAKRNYYARQTLRDRRGSCQGYSELFVLLARRAGVRAMEVTGYCRGAGFKPGVSVKNDHAWNAVLIDSRWYLMDITYGAGVVSGEKFLRQYQEHYFLTPPKELMYTHLPEVRRWSLLPGCMSKREFELLPFYRPGFFQYDLTQLDEGPSCVIVCRRSLQLRFSAPPAIKLIAEVRDAAGKSLSRPRIIRKGGIIEIAAEFDKPGDYYLLGWAGPEVRPKQRSWAFSYLVKNR
jgi:transglutaminase/protease-like cytokinesis protein 3